MHSHNSLPLDYGQDTSFYTLAESFCQMFEKLCPLLQGAKKMDCILNM